MPMASYNWKSSQVKFPKRMEDIANDIKAQMAIIDELEKQQDEMKKKD